jgi:hypothetical protein
VVVIAGCVRVRSVFLLSLLSPLSPPLTPLTSSDPLPHLSPISSHQGLVQKNYLEEVEKQ